MNTKDISRLAVIDFGHAARLGDSIITDRDSMLH